MMRSLIVLLILAISIVMVIFGAQNTQPVEVQFLAYRSGAVSLSLVIIMAALGGAVLASLANLMSSIQRSWRERATRRKLEQRIRELEAQSAQRQKDLGALQAAAAAAARPAQPPPPSPASAEPKSGRL